MFFLLLLYSHGIKSNTLPWVFFTFFKSYKWYQIAQRITYIFDQQTPVAGYYYFKHCALHLGPRDKCQEFRSKIIRLSSGCNITCIIIIIIVVL